MGPRENHPAFIPDNLLGIEEADSLETVEDFPGEDRSVPDIRDLNTGNEFESFGPIRASI